MSPLRSVRRVAGLWRPSPALPTLAAILLGAGALWAHAVVVPATSAPRAYETYRLRVPNEKEIPTVRIHISFPPDVFVVSFAEVPGWTLEVSRDSTDRAIAATWTGELAPHRFVELPFVGVNPAEPTTLVWEVDQVYAGDSGEEIVRWAGSPDSEFPASRTVVAPPPAPDDGAPDVFGPLALFVAVLALGVSLRAVRGRRGNDRLDAEGAAPRE